MKKTVPEAVEIVSLTGSQTMTLLVAAFGPAGYASAWKVNAARESPDTIRVAIGREDGGERTLRVRLPDTFVFEIVEEIG